MQKQTTRKAKKATSKATTDEIQEDSSERALEEECEEVLGNTTDDSNKHENNNEPDADVLCDQDSAELSEEEDASIDQDIDEECGSEQNDHDDQDDQGEQDGQGEQDDNLIDAKELGRRGEQAAVRFLERKGIEILERNWTCLAGEADIIAFDDEALRFVEVKTRTDVSKGFPSEAVTKKKRQRYEKIAALYLQESDFPECRVTFDVIAILVTGSHRAFLKYHRDAFAFDVAR